MSPDPESGRDHPQRSDTLDAQPAPVRRRTPPPYLIITAILAPTHVPEHDPFTHAEDTMPRKPAPRSSDDLAREIERLQEQRAQIEVAEHTRRGELLRQLLNGPKGDALRQVLDPLVTGTDRHLFGLPPAVRGSRPSASTSQVEAVL